jgi:hypothetical protein
MSYELALMVFGNGYDEPFRYVLCFHHRGDTQFDIEVSHIEFKHLLRQGVPVWE